MFTLQITIGKAFGEFRLSQMCVSARAHTYTYIPVSKHERPVVILHSSAGITNSNLHQCVWQGNGGGRSYVSMMCVCLCLCVCVSLSVYHENDVCGYKYMHKHKRTMHTIQRERYAYTRT